MSIGYISRDLQVEEGKGIISHVNECTYLGIGITKEGSHEPEINERIIKIRAAITKLKCIMWDSDVTSKTKTHIYHAIVKKHNYICRSNMLFLTAKILAKINSAEMDFWRRSARNSRKDYVRNTVTKQKLKDVRSLLDDIKTRQLQWYACVQRMEDCQKKS
jgi:hypothetical protein